MRDKQENGLYIIGYGKIEAGKIVETVIDLLDQCADKLIAGCTHEAKIIFCRIAYIFECSRAAMHLMSDGFKQAFKMAVDLCSAIKYRVKSIISQDVWFWNWCVCQYRFWAESCEGGGCE